MILSLKKNRFNAIFHN